MEIIPTARKKIVPVENVGVRKIIPTHGSNLTAYHLNISVFRFLNSSREIVPASRKDFNFSYSTFLSFFNVSLFPWCSTKSPCILYLSFAIPNILHLIQKIPIAHFNYRHLILTPALSGAAALSPAFASCCITTCFTCPA